MAYRQNAPSCDPLIYRFCKGLWELINYTIDNAKISNDHIKLISFGTYNNFVMLLIMQAI